MKLYGERGTTALWQRLNTSEREKLIPELTNRQDWIILTDLTGKKTNPAPPFPGAKLIASANGNASRKRGWWKEDDGLVSYGLATREWIRMNSDTPTPIFETLSIELSTDSKKDEPKMGNDGVENTYLSGTETGLLRITEVSGIIYTTDGFKDNDGMGARFYRHDTGGGGCCKVVRTEEGLSSNRPEHVAAWLALSDTLKSDELVIILTDSLGLLTSIQNWIGEGTDPIVRKSPDRE